MNVKLTDWIQKNLDSGNPSKLFIVLGFVSSPFIWLWGLYSNWQYARNRDPIKEAKDQKIIDDFMEKHGYNNAKYDNAPKTKDVTYGVDDE